MALIKKKLTDMGIEADYWKVHMISIDRHMQNGSFSISLYGKKGAKQFIETHTVPIMDSVTDYIECFETCGYKDIQTSCYAYAKKHIDFFKDAIDDEEENLRNLSESK